MHISRVDRAHASEAQGVVIAIDVIRAFTVAGYAFAGGARSMWLVKTIEEAQALRAHAPDALLGGEVRGRLIPGFDFNNSPTRVAASNIQGKQLIQRTGAGTQGAVGATQAEVVLLCALTNAQATADYACKLIAKGHKEITLLPTATLASEDAQRNEDDMCADYVEALLREDPLGSERLARDIDYLRVTHRFQYWEADEPDFPRADIEAILAVNRFPFAMVGRAQEWQGIHYIEAVRE